jgi:hypothetical protein
MYGADELAGSGGYAAPRPPSSKSEDDEEPRDSGEFTLRELRGEGW